MICWHLVGVSLLHEQSHDVRPSEQCWPKGNVIMTENSFISCLSPPPGFRNMPWEQILEELFQGWLLRMSSLTNFFFLMRACCCWFSWSVMSLFATPWIAACQAALSFTISGACSNSCPLSQWCHPTVSSFVISFSFCPQSIPASESFPMSQLFTWSGQSIGVSALASVLPRNTQDWSLLEWTGWISLQSKGLLRVFSNTTEGAWGDRKWLDKQERNVHFQNFVFKTKQVVFTNC